MSHSTSQPPNPIDPIDPIDSFEERLPELLTQAASAARPQPDLATRLRRQLTVKRAPRIPLAIVSMVAVVALLIGVFALLQSGHGAPFQGSSSGASFATTPAPSGQGSQVDGYVPPVIVRNPAPGMLDISLSVTIDQQSGDAQPMTEVGLGFSSAGHTVQFAGNERVTCNGMDLPVKNRAAIFQVLRAPAAQVAGTTIHCDYAAGGAVAGVTLQIPSAPAITFPRVGARVVRSARTIVTYRADPATGAVLGVVALAPASTVSKAIARLNTPGPSQATLDTSGFAPGPGTLVLTMRLTPHVVATGAAFNSVKAFGMATTPMAVTWI